MSAGGSYIRPSVERRAPPDRLGTAVGSPTAVQPFTRMVLVLGVCLTVGTGPALFAEPRRTATYWAWTIKAPLTAAFFGAGYLGAAVALAWGARTREWQRVRIAVILVLTLTTIALVDTIRAWNTFAFHESGLPRVAAWIWLVVYVLLPPLALTAFVRQERAGGAHEYVSATPALTASRVAVGLSAVVLGVVGAFLVADASWLTERWPWPIPLLPATFVGAWFCAVAVGLLWFAVRERDWSRGRIGVIPMLVPLILGLVAAARLSDGFRGSTAPTVYVAAEAALAALLVTVVVVEERRLRLVRVHRSTSGRWLARHTGR
jgi:hypothetical protein